jgi:polyisoprenoid-binding protein YceI
MPLFALGLAGPATAEVFTVANTGLNRVSFESEAPFETITGVSTATEGRFELALAAPGSVKGKVKVPVRSLGTGNATRDEHLAQPQWLDASAHPDITLELEGAEFSGDAKLAPGAKLQGTVKGKLSIRGKTKSISAPVIVSYHAGSDKLAALGIAGDVLRVKARFDVALADFGVVPPGHLAGVKVADTVQIEVNLTATKE